MPKFLANRTPPTPSPVGRRPATRSQGKRTPLNESNPTPVRPLLNSPIGRRSPQPPPSLSDHGSPPPTPSPVGRRSPPPPPSPSNRPSPPPQPDFFVPAGDGVDIDRSTPVMIMCWKADYSAPTQLTVYARDDLHVRMEDHKLVLGSAEHQIEMGNTLQRFMPGRQFDKGRWVTIRWDSPIPVQGAGHRIILRYRGVKQMEHWAAHSACAFD
ncbi:hypothetical protein B0H15DRAFT_826335 [Mycena belliarum]|uniref:Uncharacterized protein n=1 Tax=Mycena belliarum TaxID=1033014 RepID=A0AAD6UFH0_9AGAR|nr:hypothetical protein B0H15DRAFT_826335 [Mycena belliae]